MKTTKLAVLEPDEIFKLVDYIEKFAKEGEDKKQFALTHMQDFFVDCTLEQRLILSELVEKRDYFGLETFIKENPSLTVNLDGDTKKDPIDEGLDAKAMALNLAHNGALSETDKTSRQKQIISARTLGCLYSCKKFPYSFEKLKITQEYPNLKILQNLAVYEQGLKEYRGEEFMALVFEYFRHHPKHTTFLEYVFYYLDIVMLDKNNKQDIKSEYLTNINKILDSFKD